MYSQISAGNKELRGCLRGSDVQWLEQGAAGWLNGPWSTNFARPRDESQNPHLPTAVRSAASPVKITGEVLEAAAAGNERDACA
jgi:hypothetical protein